MEQTQGVATRPKVQCLLLLLAHMLHGCAVTDQILSAQLLRMCILMKSSTQMYCPRLAPDLVGKRKKKIHLHKKLQKKKRKSTQPHQGLKGQTLTISKRGFTCQPGAKKKKSHMYRKKLHLLNCKYERTQTQTAE